MTREELKIAKVIVRNCKDFSFNQDGEYEPQEDKDTGGPSMFGEHQLFKRKKPPDDHEAFMYFSVKGQKWFINSDLRGGGFAFKEPDMDPDDPKKKSKNPPVGTWYGKPRASDQVRGSVEVLLEWAEPPSNAKEKPLVTEENNPRSIVPVAVAAVAATHWQTKGHALQKEGDDQFADVQLISSKDVAQEVVANKPVVKKEVLQEIESDVKASNDTCPCPKWILDILCMGQ